MTPGDADRAGDGTSAGGAHDAEGARQEDPTRRPTGKAGAECDLCGGRMIDRHCKLTCTVCGYQRDCSDP